jgi:hypothetical protein
VAGARKTTRKGTDKATEGKPGPRRKTDPAPAKTKAAGKKPSQKTAQTKAGHKKPVRKTTQKKQPAAGPGRHSPPHDVEVDARPAAALAQQRRAGYALIVVSAVGIVGIGAWVTADSLNGTGHWALRAVFRSVCIALIGYFLWTVLDRRRAVSGALVLGASAVTLLLYDAGSAWWVDRARSLTNRTLLQLKLGERDIESLTTIEIGDPYIEAYVVMRDIYWELDARADDEMSRYRSHYENYTAEGAFLDTERLATTADISRSILEIDDLQHRLVRVETSRPDISDLLLTVGLLNVDAETRAAYADDVRTARESFVEATAVSVAREREALRTMRHALEALLDAQGRYRIQDGRIIFEDPEDAARFAGKAEAG